MAVKKCKECGEKVSTTAKKCPHCGAKPPKKSSPLIWIFLLVIVAYIFTGGGGSSTTPKDTKVELSPEKQAEIEREAKQRAQESFERDLIYDAKKAVSATLKDPSSAEYKNVFFNETKAGGAVVCGQVNSKNSFGAFSGFQRFISNGKTTFLEERDNNIADTWVQVCLPEKG